jgi:hypothetical protein
MNIHNKLECLLLAVLFSLTHNDLTGLERPYRSKHYSLFKNIKITSVKSFITLGQGQYVDSPGHPVRRQAPKVPGMGVA